MKQAVGVEAENFKPVNGWCYGYAPVNRSSRGRRETRIPEGHRTLNITKLGAGWNENQIEGVTVVWTAKHPLGGPVIVGLYDNAVIYRLMVADEAGRPFITKARVEDCHLVPETDRTFQIIQKQEGFPGMASAWFPGLHLHGPAKDLLFSASAYIQKIRKYSYAGF